LIGGEKMLIRIAAVLLAALPLAACQKKPATEAPIERPNIVYILADDLGFADIGAFGGEIPTPNLDALARGGMLLTDFHTSMTCSPTRAMLMSGMDNHRAGMGVQGRPSREDQQGQPGYEGHLNFRVAALPELLTDAGYNTYMTGKWHLGTEVAQGPKARGFKRVFASLDGAAHLGPWDWRGPQNAKFFDGDAIVEVGEDWYSTRDYTKKMIEFIEQDRAEGKPFFAWLAYTAPHWPLQAPKESIAKFKGRYDAGYEALYAERFAKQKELGLVAADATPIDNARFNPRWDSLTEEQKRFESRRMEIYAAMVSDMDEYVGQVVDYLKETGQFDNTFIMFSSDNGAEPGRRDLTAPIAEHVGKAYDHSLDNIGSATSYVMYGPNWASGGATPWNRHKFTSFQGGVRVPAFVHFAPKVEAGTRSDAVSTIMDVLPTLLGLAGTSHPGTNWNGREVLPPQGVSLLPVLYGETAEVHPADAVFGWELSGYRAIRQGDWRLVWDQGAPQEQRRWQLFNLAADPFELKDVATSSPNQLQQMLALWEQYDEENGVVY
jgi:arylsulfatase A-like enzyme